MFKRYKNLLLFSQDRITVKFKTNINFVTNAFCWKDGISTFEYSKETARKLVYRVGIAPGNCNPR